MIFTLFLLALAIGKEVARIESLVLVTKATEFTAGTPIKLEFTAKSNSEKPQLFIIHSYGKTLLEASVDRGNYVFELPENYCEKTGKVSWFLILEHESIASGTLQILPNPKTKTVLENYFGPRKIMAGGREFSMMVVVPTDGFDNPKESNTTVKLKYQFLQNISTLDLRTNNFIAWYNIYSPDKAGKILVSTECENTVSKEIETEVYPNIATDFSINYSRNHEFADGNQLTRFSTSIIRDQFGNVVSDGTLVYFIIRTKENMLLKTFGATINGIASAQILHPDHQDSYQVKAYVMGIAESNSITINYKPVAASFDYALSHNNRTLRVGPIKSFMNQLVPDGITVVLNVLQKNKIVATLEKETSKGIAFFEISDDILAAGNFQLEIKTLGISKKTPILRNDHQQ
ncbi:hypothetical protein [Flavobacterium sp.]|uniref:hypothetical protein n=1 Tax=Flavobacterium sp. TaxID=239 RepID=UPI00262FCB6E|nr:hypothetical protein [Flavobacterium sp.]